MNNFFTDFDGRTLVVSKAGIDALAITRFASDVDTSRKYSAHCHFLTVQAAIDFAQPGDNINVHAGDYTNEGVIVLKDRVSITTDANVTLPDLLATNVQSRILGNPDILGVVGLTVEGVSDLRIELGLMVVEQIAIRLGTAIEDDISLSGYTGDIVSQGRGVWVSDGNINLDIDHNDVYAAVTAYRVGAPAGDAGNRASIDVRARDLISERISILHTGLNTSDTRIQARDIIATSLMNQSPSDRYAVWLNSPSGDFFSPEDSNRITIHFRDMIGNPETSTEIVTTLRVNNGVAVNDAPTQTMFLYGDRIIYNGANDAPNSSTDGAVVFSKGSDTVGRSSVTLDVREILGRASKAINYTEAVSGVNRTGLLRVVNANISNDNGGVSPVRVQTGSLAHITFEGSAIYTPANQHVSAQDPTMARIYHKTQTLVNKPDQNSIQLVTDWDGVGGNTNQVDSLRTSGGAALVSETPYTRIPDADLLAVVNI